MNSDSLIYKYLEDKESMSEVEMDELILLFKDPEKLISVKENLILDEYLSRHFSVDRQNFENQVLQRVYDEVNESSKILTLDEIKGASRNVSITESGRYRNRPIKKPHVSSRKRVASSRKQKPDHTGYIVVAALICIAFVLFIINNNKPDTIIDPKLPPKIVNSSIDNFPVLSNLKGNVYLNNVAINILKKNKINLKAGDTIFCGAGGSFDFIYDEETSKLNISEATEIRVIGRKSFFLNHGQIDGDIAKQKSKDNFQIINPNSKIQVLGTKFSYCYSRAKENSPIFSELKVDTGLVEIERHSDGKIIKVPGGSFAVVSSNVALRSKVLPTKKEEWRFNGKKSDFFNGFKSSNVQMINGQLEFKKKGAVALFLFPVQNWSLPLKLQYKIKVGEHKKINQRSGIGFISNWAVAKDVLIIDDNVDLTIKQGEWMVVNTYLTDSYIYNFHYMEDNPISCYSYRFATSKRVNNSSYELRIYGYGFIDNVSIKEIKDSELPDMSIGIKAFNSIPKDFKEPIFYLDDYKIFLKGKYVNTKAKVYFHIGLDKSTTNLFKNLK